MSEVLSSYKLKVVSILGLSSIVSIGLWLAGAIANHSIEFWYLIWNLFLAWLPLLIISWLINTLKNRLWLNWLPILLTVLWLGFLPNSFYLVTDFVHLQFDSRVDVLFDAAMIESFVINGLILGFLSLYLVHNQLRRRMGVKISGCLVALTLALCSYAIYLGRDLRLNSWDTVVNPARLLFSVADTFLSPVAHSEALTTTLTVFVLLSSLYFIFWQIAKIFFRQIKARI